MRPHLQYRGQKHGQASGAVAPPQDGSITIMSNETKESLREKLAQARDTLDEVNDPAARAFIRVEIEELERHLLLTMGKGPES